MIEEDKDLTDSTIIEAFHKIMRLEAERVHFTIPDYEIIAYDTKDRMIRIDVKLR